MPKKSPSFEDISAKDLALFEGVSPDKRRSVLRCLEAQTSMFVKGDLLAGRDLNFPRTRYLVEGSAVIIRYDEEGNRSILGNYDAESLVACELTPYFCEKNSIDIIADEPCVTLDFLFPDNIEARPCCAKNISRICSNLIEALTDTNMQLIKHLDTLANRSMREKILSYLEDQEGSSYGKTFSIPYNRQELADYLYIERSALSRELSRMQQDGIISYDKNDFVILTH